MSVMLCNRCRLCSDECHQEKDSIFSNGNNLYLMLVAKYIDLHISSDDILPVNVCETCRLTIRSFDDYVTRCKDAQETLVALHESCLLDDKGVLKIEVKNEKEDECKVEQIIKTEDIDYFENAEDMGDFCDEDFLPLIATLTKAHAPRSSSRISKKDKRGGIKKKKDKTKKVKDKTIKKDKKEHKVKKEVKVKIEKQNSLFEDSVSIQSSFFNFSCYICNDKFNRFPELQRHTRAEHNERGKVLCMCNKYLKTRKQIIHHLLKHVHNYGIQCPMCPRKFVREKYLTIHLETHNIEYKCTQCPKVFKTSIGVRTHEKSHIPVELRATHSCDICLSKFLNKTAVTIHKNAVHEKYKPYICDGCGKNFVTNGALNAHRAIHDLEPKLACPKCPKKFKVKAHLKRHLDYHNGVTFKCPECPALFNTKRTLTSHFLIHRDVYKFVCGYCDKKFKWKTSFQSHINNHTGATPYKCDWCPKTFTDGPNCRIHKKRKHPVELAVFDAKRAAENPRLERQQTSIIKEIKLKNPSIRDAVTFPLIRKNDKDLKESVDKINCPLVGENVR